MDRISELSPEQRDQLLKKLAGDPSARREPELQPVERAGGAAVPLSFAQESAWFLDRLSPGDPAHNLAGGLRLEGSLSVPALAAAFDALLARHETLRASFAERDGAPAQQIAPPEPTELETIDLSDLTAAEREAESRRLFVEESRRGFDLTRDRVLRARLLRLAPEEHLLLLTVHRIAADGWAMGVLMTEVAELYSAYAASRQPEIAPPPLQYGDFAAWQRQRMEGEALERELGYWRRQLEDLPPPVELPPERSAADAATPAARGLPGELVVERIGPELKRRLAELGRAEGATLFATLLAAFLVVLMRRTGEEDLVVGTPVSGRTRVEAERLVGVFLNTLALRVRLSPDLTFRQALGRVRETVLRGLEHHEVPLERVVQQVDPERAASGQPLFATVFNFTPSPPRRLSLAGLTATFEEPPEMRAKFLTELFVTDRGDGALRLKLLYPRALYSRPAMSSLLEQLAAVLEQVTRDPETVLGALDLATAGSRALLPDPARRLAAPPQTPIPAVLGEWAERDPDRAAIQGAGVTLTYAELRDRATALAELLRAAGLQPGDVVAVMGARSPGIAVSMVATLLAGGVLLTLSLDLPEERHRVMLQDAGARFLLYVGGVRDADRWLGELDGLRRLPVGEDGAAGEAAADRDVLAGRPGGESFARLVAELGADGRTPEGAPRPAYVFFTSGSTGRPKGFLGTHAGLAHFLAWQRETFDVGPGDRCGQLTGLSFDVVLRDVFLPLTAGALLVLPAAADTASAEGTLRWLEREAISLLHTVPSLAEAWLLAPPAEVTLGGLRRVFFAGEPLTAALVARWRRSFPGCGEVVNLYGPAETTLAKLFYRVPASPRPGIQPLGRPLPDTQALVLTPDRRLCGLGEPGEIALRTPFRSLGYIGAPEENERRFIPNPFGAGDAADIVYLTGDRGRYSAEGLVEFLGRVDDQVKIRGIRVEPTEVAVTLQASPEVASCAVVARQLEADGGLGLVAYVVPAAGSGESPGRLQEYLRQRLPAAMVPSLWVFLDELPRTANQKLDRERLPPPDQARPSLEGGYLAPRDATELRLAQIWSDLLEVRPVGVRDNFFELGGHSLLAMHLLVRVEQGLGRKVPLAALFENPTIEHLAAAIRGQEKEWPLAVELWAAEHPHKLFLVHPGGGTLHNYTGLVRHLGAELPVYGLQARGLDGRSEPQRDLSEMAATYLEEVRGLQPAGPYLLAGHSLGGVIAYEMARQLETAGEEVALLALFDSVAPRPGGERRPPQEERLRDARSLAEMVDAIERFAGKEISVSYDELAALATDQQIERVAAALEQSEALPPGGGAALTRTMLEVGKAHVEAGRAFVPGAAGVPITLFRARDAAPPEPAAGDDSLGWSAVATAPVTVVWTPGDHVTMMGEPHVDGLAAGLRSRLSAVLSRLELGGGSAAS